MGNGLPSGPVSSRVSKLSDVPLPASKNRIDRAGDLIREWWTTPDINRIDVDQELRAAAVLMFAFRAGFQDPLVRVTMGMRSFVRTEGAPVLVTQRLKRAPTIAGKLARMPTVRLCQMQDIAGCRAILPSQPEVYDVVRRIRRRSWDIRRLDDYMAKPKATGYRAVHVVVRRRGRLVEIQLRTPAQQRWAAEVDRAAGQIGLGLKDGQGPPELVAAFAELAEEIAHSGVDAASHARLDEAFQAIRQQVRGYIPTK